MSLPIKIMICVLGCIGLGTASGLSSGTALTEWYQTLNKPVFQPPSWIFGPAWTLLYTLMGIAIARIWHRSPQSQDRQTAIRLFIVQFVLNLIWSPVFFGAQNPTVALVIIIVMWCLILLTIKAFKKVDSAAAFLMIPYILWVTFATVLNASIVYLN